MRYHLQFDLSFTPNTFPGRYFAFEGIDGSGKTTQVHKLAEYFRDQGKKVVITKEPTEGVIGQLIKRVVHEEIAMPATSLQYLFAADRGIHIEKEVIPALQQGNIVISDRSFWSALAYGITDLSRHSRESRFNRENGGNLQDGSLTKSGMTNSQDDRKRNRLLVAYNILSLYGGFLVPDKTFVIDIPADIAMERVHKRKLEETLYEKTETLRKVQQEYAWMGKKFSEYLVLIDGKKSVEEVFREIVSNL